MRARFLVQGTVQGVGYRPFVRRLAAAHGLTGWVSNGRSGVSLEIQGSTSAVGSFWSALSSAAPPAAAIAEIERVDLDDIDGEDAFRIVASEATGVAHPVLPADLATCEACWTEVRAPGARRYHYPFTNCAECGPRYSITLGLPYDRSRTSMASFLRCADCAREYADTDDRRYHAQPIACPRCGPTLSLLDAVGRLQSTGGDALSAAAEAIREGEIVALRGLGGFQLVCSALDHGAVRTLRERKRRPHKPFAVLFRDHAQLAESAAFSETELRLLSSRQAPIVLLHRRVDSPLAEEVAPASPLVGAMLPATPLHGLLIDQVGSPVVCTSGNLTSEPICVSEEEALARLGPIADRFLTHDREVARPLDDSVARVSSGGEVHLIRRARGYTPSAIARAPEDACVLALGAHQKSTVTLAHRGWLVPSQHLGDLDSPAARDLLAKTVADLCAFFGATPGIVACDLHPDYASTLLAQSLAAAWGARLARIQHHHAHVASCIAEHALDGPVLGLAWDGAGLGDDRTIWGGEALVCEGTEHTRFATLSPFPLPGGDRASREPRRAALGALFAFAPASVESVAGPWFGAELDVLVRTLERKLNAPLCSSVGRLFDTVAALAGMPERQTFEGQAASRLEHLAASVRDAGSYAVTMSRGEGAPRLADTAGLMEQMLSDVRERVDTAIIASRFHAWLIELACEIAAGAGIEQVVLAGGCFQNRLLSDGIRERLTRRGFRVLEPELVPANDGGISVGQAWLAANALEAC